jgi:intracellular septation protein A
MLSSLRLIARDFLSTIVFLGVYWTTHDLLLATGVAIGAAMIQFAIMLARRQPIGIMQWMSIALVIGLGALTFYTQDSRFIRLKPTIAHAIVAAVMLKPGWQRPYMPEIVRTWMSAGELTAWGFVWAGWEILLGVGSFFAATVLTVDQWGLFTLAAGLSHFGVFFVQYFAMRTLIRQRVSAAQASPAAT